MNAEANITWRGGFGSVLNVENEMLQVLLRRTKALVITRNRNKALKYTWVNSYRYEQSFITLSKRSWVNPQQIPRWLKQVIFSLQREKDLRILQQCHMSCVCVCVLY